MRLFGNPSADGAAMVRAMLVAVSSLMAACGPSQVSRELSSKALTKDGDAVIAMAVVLDRATERSCKNVTVSTMDNKPARTTSGQLVTIRLGLGSNLDSAAEVIGSTSIAPGAYKIIRANCVPPR